ALRGGARAGRAVERERRAGCDQLSVEQTRDELDVVDPVRVTAVDRLVAADRPVDPERSRLARRAARLDRPDYDAGAPRVVRERGGEQAGGCARRVEYPSLSRRNDPDGASRRDREAGVSGGPVERSAEVV